MNTQSPLFKTIARVLIAVMWAQPLHSIAANLQVDQQGGGNTHVSAAGNGVPVVNIATPNGKGLSHNKFIDYNVGQQGLILNNSTDKLTQTQLGGIITGNSQLNGKAAGTILNEVTGGQRSQLKGYTEVAGKQAHVIVANPHGITCDGCGFINTPHATLTTGKPMIEQGQLQGYDVDGGDIEIAGAGLNASNISRFDLITRSAKINAELHANQLNIITGRNQVEAGTLKATAKTGPANEQPLLAIDSSALGGMYAGAIRLVGTEAGVGVKLAGDMAASAGDIRIDANGKLTLARVAASDNLVIKADEALLEQQAYAGQDLSVQSDLIENSGELLAGKNIALTASQLNNTALIEAGVAADTATGIKGSVAIRTDSVRNSGAIIASQDISITSQLLDNRKGKVYADQTVQITTDSLDNSGQALIASGQQLDIAAGLVKNSSQGLLAGKGDVQIVADQLDNSDEGAISSSEGSVRLRLDGDLINEQGTLVAAQNTEVFAANLDNSSGTIATGADASIELAGTLDNTAGQIAANSLHMTAGQLDNDAGLILADQAMRLTVAGQLSNRAGGEILGGQALTLTADRVDNQNSRIVSENWLQVIARELRNNQQAVISAYRSLGVDTGELENLDDSAIYSEQAELNILAGRLRNSESLIQAREDIDIQTTGLTNQTGRILSDKGDIEIRVEGTGVLTNSGTIAAGQDLKLNVEKLTNESALLLAGQNMQLSVGQLHNQHADIYSVGDIRIQGRAEGTKASRLDNLSATIEAGQDLHIVAKEVENKRSVLETLEGKYFASIKELPCGSPYPAGDCKLGSNGRRNAVWQLTERDKLEVVESTAAAEIMAGRDLTIEADTLSNHSSRLSAGGDIRFELGQLNNIGVSPYDIELTRVFVSGRKPDYYYYAGLASSFNTTHATQVQSSTVQRDISRFVGAMDVEYMPGRKLIEAGTVDESYSAIIQAGGAIQIRASETLENSVIRPSFAYVSGGTRNGGTAETLLQINPQHRDELKQQIAGSPSFSLPQGSQGLFRISGNPRHNYLIETNPALTQMRQFLSSDYLLGGLGLSPDDMQKRLGDGLYEQKLIREALIARTGQRYIAGLNSDEAMFRYLMDNAIASKDALNLSVGISLTAEQVAALTHDIVWLEERELLGETVLVPVLYMVQAEGRLASNGALIQGQDLALISGGDLSNQGTLRASSSLGVQAQNIQNSGLMQAGERLSLLAEGSISNRQGGILAGRDVDLTARTGDILNERSITRHESALGNSRWETSFADSAARIEAANSLSLNAGRDVQNLGGVLQSGGDMQISAGRDVSLSSVEERHGNSRDSHYLNSQTTQLISETLAGGNLSIEAGRNLIAVASRIESRQNMQLTAGNDLTLAAAANESHHYSKSKRRTSQRDLVQQQGTEVVSGGQFTAVSGNDLTLISSNVTANDEAYLVAGGKVQLLAEQDVDYSFYEKKKKGSFGRKRYRMNENDSSNAVVSSIRSGADAVIYSDEDIIAHGASLQAGGTLEVRAANDIQLLVAENSRVTASAKSKKGLVSSKAKTSSQSSTEVVGTSVHADSVQIIAERNLSVSAGDLRADGDMLLYAGEDLGLTSQQQYSSQNHSKQSSKLGFGHHALLTHTQKQKAAEQGSGTAVGSYVGANNLVVGSGQDISITGSTLISDNDMRLSAGRNLDIGSAQDTSYSATSSSSKKTGEIGSWWQPATGQIKQKVTTQANTSQQSGSQLASLGGNISLQAGEAYHQTVSSLLALDGDITIHAKQVKIEAGHDELSHSETRKTNRTAVGGSVSIPVVSAIQNMQQVNRARGRTDDQRMQTLAAATMAMQGKAVYDSAQAMAGGNAGGIKISINLSNSNSKSTTAQEGRNVAASSVLAGGDVHIRATGSEESDINIIGSRVSAGQDVTLQADRNIFLSGAQNTAQQNSRDNGGGWSAGIGFGLGGSQNGFTLELAANQFRGKADGSDIMWSNTQVEAGRRVHMESGADIKLQGAVVKGDQVTADIGGNLIVESLQDRSTYQSRQSSSSAGVSLCIPPFCAGTSTASASQSNSKAKGDYTSVNQQSGIQAGDGGFQLTVAGKTELTGAVIASSEQAVQGGLNRLETGTLVVSDLHNHSDYKASSAGLVASYDFGIGKDNKAAMAESNQDKAYSSDLTGSAVSRISGSDNSVTRSAISQADIVITDLKAQQELTGQTATALLGKLNDAVRSGDSSGGIAKNWDGKKLERVVQANAEIMTAFSQQATYAVNSYVNEKRQELLSVLKPLEEKAREEGEENAEQNAKAVKEIQDQINMLNTQSRAVQILIGAATGQLETAAAHGLLQEAADQMRQYSIKSSSTFKGVIIGVNEDGTDKILSNLSGDSAGVRGDGKKLGGVRVDLDLICGKDNSRCVTQEDDNGKPILDSNGIPELKWENGTVKFDEKKAGMDFDKFLTTKDGRKMSGLTGGVQGLEGTIAGKPYAPNGFWDHVIESFAGAHDAIGGDITGLYDKQGNTTRGLSDAQSAIYNTWSVIAIVPSAFFAMPEALPTEAWQVLEILLKGGQ